MVASSLFLSMILLAASAPAHARPVDIKSDVVPVRPHLVVPTGIAVPMGRHEALPAPSDLFKSAPVEADQDVIVLRAYRSDPVAGSL